MEQVGTVASAWRYPVKSMAGEPLEVAAVTLQGVLHDRAYAFVQAESKSAFPWLTGRELPTLFLYRPSWSDEQPPRLVVHTPSGMERPIADDSLRAELEDAAGRPLHLLRDYRGSFDVAPLSVITTATVEGIAAASDTPPEGARFRMNLYVDAPGTAVFGEDAWVGRVLRFGESVRMAVTERDSRCAMITLSPHGGAPLTPVLTAVAKLNDNTAGVYGSVLAAGEIRSGDPVYLED